MAAANLGLGLVDPIGVFEMKGGIDRVKFGDSNLANPHLLSSNRDIVFNADVTSNGILPAFTFRRANYNNLNSSTDLLSISAEGDLAIRADQKILASGANTGMEFSSSGNITVSDDGNGITNVFFSIRGNNGKTNAFSIDANKDNFTDFAIRNNGDMVAGLHNNTDPVPQNVVTDSNNRIRQAVSSRRYKKHISAVELDVDKYLTLQTKKWQFKKQDPSNKGWDYGFIAEEVDSLNLDLPLSIKRNGRVETVRYNNFAFYNFTAIKEHRARIVELEDENEELKAHLSDVQADLSIVQAEYQSLQTKVANLEKLENRLAQLEALWQSAEAVSYTHLTLPTNREV